jgi:hypothetical protein
MCNQNLSRTIVLFRLLSLLELRERLERLAVALGGWLGPRVSQICGLKVAGPRSAEQDRFQDSWQAQEKQAPKKIGSSGRTRTYNPPVNRTELARQFNNVAAQMTTLGAVRNQRVTSGA